MSGKRSADGGKGNRRVGKGKNVCVRGIGAKVSKTSAEELPSSSKSKMSTSFRGQPGSMPLLRSRGSVSVIDEEQKEKVLEWIASAPSSGLSSTSTSQTLHSSEVSPKSHLPPHSSQVSSHPTDNVLTRNVASEELFSHTIAWESEVFSIPSVSQDDEMLCTDAQNLCESHAGTDTEASSLNVDPHSQTLPPVGGDNLSEDDETQISDCNDNLALRSVQEQVGSEDDECDKTQGDDEVEDPTYCQPTGRHLMSSREEVEEEEASDEVRLRLPGQRRSPGSTSTAVSSATTLPLSRSGGGSAGRMGSKPCLAWPFFQISKEEPTNVICQICKQKLSRGQKMNSLSTSCMNRHMDMKHRAQWDAHRATMRLREPGQPTSYLSSSSGVSSSSVTMGTSGPQSLARKSSTSLPATASVRNRSSGGVDLETPAGVERCQMSRAAPYYECPTTPPSQTSSLSVTPYSPLSQHSSQPSVPQMWTSKRPFPPNHAKSKLLNFTICKLLATEMLPFRLVDSEDFRELMALAVPQYQMPSRHYFSKKGVPALHQHVACNITTSLQNSLCDRVHFTTDTWTSKHGQGRYMSLTGHWVTMVTVGEGSAVQVLTPPRLVRQTPGSTSCSAASASSTSSRSSTCAQSLSGHVTRVQTAQKESSTPPYFAGSRAQRHQAVFSLKSMGNVSHTAEQLWSALESEFTQWLSPLNLQPGKAVCDNAANLGAALRRGKVTHVPCMAHVLNLVVQQFLAHYPGVDGLLQRARSLCAHFRRSHPAAQRLASLQQSLGLPIHRLKCDVPTRWNSTLHMLQRLWQHRRALVQYVLTYSLGQRDPEVGQITLIEWSQMNDLCTLLQSFEMATKMFSADDAIISMTIPVIYMLEHTLTGIRSQVVGREEVEEQEEVSEGIPTSHGSRRSTAQRRLAWEGGGEGFTRAHGDSQNVVLTSGAEEEMEDEEALVMEDSGNEGDPDHIAVVRGWGEGAEEGSGTVLSPPPTQQGFGRRGCARHMSAFLLHYLQHDPRIVRIRSNADYWVATLLDPRYKNKFGQMIPALERDARMQEYQQKLLQNLASAFPRHNTGAPGESQSSTFQNMGTSSRHSSRGNRTNVSGNSSNFAQSFHHFFRASIPTPEQRTTLTHSERLQSMVQQYLELNIDAMTVELDPCSFWVSKLGKWPELATHALEILSCPAASVLSERVFSAAGSVLTDKRTRLSSDSVDRLTFIKMNKSWIRKDFSTPVSAPVE